MTEAEQWGVALLNSIRGQPTEADALHVLRVALAAGQRQARTEALEDAAQIADVAEHERWTNIAIAKRIRALKVSP